MVRFISFVTLVISVWAVISGAKAYAAGEEIFVFANGGTQVIVFGITGLISGYKLVTGSKKEASDKHNENTKEGGCEGAKQRK